MDYEKFVDELLAGPLGDLARERFVTELIEDLAHYTDQYTYESDEDRENARAWATGTAEWLRDDYL